MRIAVVLSSLRGGGAERVMMSVADGLQRKGHLVDLVVCNATGAYRTSLPEQVSLYDLASPRVIMSIFKLVKYLIQSSPDCVISALPHVNLVSIIARFLARSKTLLVITEHNTLSQSTKHSISFRGRYLHILMRLLYRYPTSIVAVSNGVADDLSMVLHIPRNRIRVIYNPVVTEALFEKANEPLSHPWFKESRSKTILAAGRLTTAKNFSSLIRAVAALSNKQDARLIILGDGPQRTALIQLAKQLGIENRLCIPGFVDNPYSYMARANVFVLSSKWEGLPTVLIEALACGVPVISTDCPSGPVEILENGKWGILVPVNDDTALASSLDAILDQPTQRSQSASWHRFSFANSISKYHDLLEQLAC